MSRIICTADVHLGITGRLNDIIWALDAMAEYAKNNGIRHIVILGDLFHDRTNINIEVLSNAVDYFSKNCDDLEFIILAGNHDQYLRNSLDVNSLKSLKSLVTVIDSVKLIKIDGKRFWIIPFINYESIYMKVLAKVEEKYEDGDVLLTHVGVHNALLNECFLIRNWSVVNFEDSKFDKVFTGHFHCHQNVSGRGNVWYPGSPIPFTFADGGVNHGFIVYDTDNRDVEFMDLFELNSDGYKPPKFLTFKDTDVQKAEVAKLKGNNIRVLLTREYSRDELFRLRNSIKERGVKDIKWLQEKQDEKTGNSKASSDITIAKPNELFSKWIDFDKPKGYSKELLLKLNESISDEAAIKLRSMNEELSD